MNPAMDAPISWWALIGIPILVGAVGGLLGNLLTPIARSLVLGSLTAAGKSLNLLGRKGLLLRRRQLEDELNSLAEMMDAQKLILYIANVYWMQFFMIWVFLLVLVAFMSFPFLVPAGLKLELVLAILLGAGGAQTFLFLLVIGRFLGQLKGGAEYREKVGTQIQQIDTLLKAGAERQ